jgi:enterochelin esterase-like enzyme
MPSGLTSPRTQTWLESLGEWTWPGRQIAAAEVLPPAWVPTSPPAGARPAAPPLPARWQRARRLLIGALLSALAAVCAGLALQGRGGLRAGSGASAADARTAPLAAPGLLPGARLQRVSGDAAGSAIERASYPSVALHHTGSFYVYLPPGYGDGSRDAARRYPVLYLLHGNSQSASAFLEIGIQDELDRLIAAHAIPPMIAVMIQGGPGANNWRNVGGLHYESYVLEVQAMIDRTLATTATRGGRAIAGLSMGGYGAMALTLNNPSRFGTVESWLGFFNGLEGRLALDRHLISRLGLRAFLYGGRSDKIADPSENGPFAARLRAAGAEATGVVYPGEHNLETVQAHLGSMLRFAGRSLAASAGGGRGGAS